MTKTSMGGFWVFLVGPHAVRRCDFDGSFWVCRRRVWMTFVCLVDDLFTFYHGKSPFFTTILGWYFFGTFSFCILLKQVQALENPKTALNLRVVQYIHTDYITVNYWSIEPSISMEHMEWCLAMCQLFGSQPTSVDVHLTYQSISSLGQSM